VLAAAVHHLNHSLVQQRKSRVKRLAELGKRVAAAAPSFDG